MSIKTENGKPKTENRPSKERLDTLLVDRGLAETRAKAQALILAGRVEVDGAPVAKAGTLVPGDVEIVLKPAPHQYVSRGGEKLAGALAHFPVSAAGKVAMDVGASTGGFTHCLLTNGVAKVYAVDVGYGQLDASLRQDPRVIVLERRNIRHLPPEDVPEPVDLITLDLSFISLTLVLPKVLEFLSPGGEILALVKPQFEVGKGQVGKGGVVRDAKLQHNAVEKVARTARSLGLKVSPAFPSPLKGPKGNQEYFLYFIAPAGDRQPIDKGQGPL
ncbi:MAG: TlyA family RNA methyltransferase [Thermodesulfobacteriota bacterium]